MWARAKSVPAPAKPVSPDTVMVPRSTLLLPEPYVCAPGSATAMLKPPPGGIGPESKRPSLDVTVSVPFVMLVQCTVWPGPIVSAAGT